jgi:Holliday junction DNA helicase RuvA
MIGTLRGVVSAVMRDTVIVDTGAIGYGVFVPVSVLAKAKEGDQVYLWTHLAVRENAEDLYGFETREELSWFEMLISVSGIGPKSALSILNAVDVASLSRAIGAKDAAGLSRAYGIGKKTAEKIVLELREKVAAEPMTKESGGIDGDVIDALVGLGYSVREARDAVHALPASVEGTENKVREAIRIASRGVS